MPILCTIRTTNNDSSRKNPGTPKPERIYSLPRPKETRSIPDCTETAFSERNSRPNRARSLYETGGGRNRTFQFLEVAKKVSHGVICLLSALSFHRIGTQNPHQVWIAIDRKAGKPKIDNTLVRIVRFSKTSLEYGVKIHEIQGIRLAVTEPAKTVADCFKYRNKIGLDVAIEALREGWHDLRFTMDDLYSAAVVCRIWNVIRPYAEALV